MNKENRDVPPEKLRYSKHDLLTICFIVLIIGIAIGGLIVKLT
jgi:hypothetical protein